jgi:hypothetical protein
VTCQAQSKDLKKLAKFMIGSFSSEKQFKEDTVNYFDIRLKIVPIWQKRKDGIWLYVEQAAANTLDKPYRQRIYQLTERQKGVFESAVYTFKNPLRFAQKPDLIAATLSPDSLSARDGCSVILSKKDNDTFEGSTEGKKCPSELRGAAYATSVVTLTAKSLLSWDKGFDDKDKQVWGATKGGYIFLKQ